VLEQVKRAFFCYSSDTSIRFSSAKKLPNGNLYQYLNCPMAISINIQIAQWQSSSISKLPFGAFIRL
jgi:hypothetical protein